MDRRRVWRQHGDRFFHGIDSWFLVRRGLAGWLQVNRLSLCPGMRDMGFSKFRKIGKRVRVFAWIGLFINAG